MKTTNLCDSCLNKKTCSKICRPVEIWLGEGQTFIFEDKIGNVTVNYGHWKEVRFGELQNTNASDDVWKDTIESTFADPNERNRPDYISAAEETLDGFKPRQLRCQVFYKQFFEQKTNKAVATEMAISPESV